MGLDRVDASSSILLVHTEVPFGVIIAYLLFKEKPTLRSIFGMIVAFIGLFILLGAPNLEGKFIGVVLLLVGAFAWSLGMVMAKPISKKIGGFAVTAWVCLFAGPLLLLGSFIFDGNTINYFLSADLKGWSIVAFLGLIMQPIAYGTWYHVMGRNPVHKVMPVMLLLPLTGLSTAIFLLGEEPTKQVFVGGAIILAGIGMILFNKSKTK
jgi:O-acetylserine/cysteine efflux transporter